MVLCILIFVLSINKSEGQEKFGGLQLENDRFTHGELYVECSHVGTSNLLRENEKYFHIEVL